MGNVIQWADYVKALNVITKEQQAVSGMSVTEAANALKYTKSASGMYLKTVMTTSTESVVGSTATEVIAGGATSGATTSAVNLTLVEGAGGVAEVAGIGSVALPIAASMAGAAGGYLIGKELNKNEAYSTFFGNLVFSIGNFITGNDLKYDFDEENAPTVPILYDSQGATYLPSGAVSGVKNYLDTVASGDAFAATLLAKAKLIITKPHALIIGPIDSIYGGNAHRYYYLENSDTPFTIRSDYTMYDINNTAANRGKQWLSDNGSDWTYYTALNGQTGDDCLISLGMLATSLYKAPYSTDDLLISAPYKTGEYASLVGTVIAKNNWNSPQVQLPSEVTKYTPSTTLPSTLKTDATGKTWKKVYLPSTSPIEMPDGEPVPEVDPDPSRLTPYITPYQPQPNGVPLVIPDSPINPIIIPNPEPDVSNTPYPPPDPNLDPSQDGDPIIIPDKDPLPNPNDTGNTVVPIIPPVPSPSSAKGLLHVYNPTPAQVDQFGEWLWTTFSGDLIDTIGKLFNNPMDAVIGLHELYCTPTTGESSVNIRAGFLESNVASRLVTSRYKEIKCGALSVPEYWGNYLDYSPYTKSYCYLPFIGIVELNTDDIVGSGVEITYRIDTYNGSCIALITTAKPNSEESLTYQFEGNCSVSVPITSGMMTALQNGLTGIATTALSAGATAAITVATGGVGLPAAVLAGTVAAGATKQAITSKNMVQHSGSFGSSFGAMGMKKPFLIIKRPRQKVVYGYNETYGYPAHTKVLISTCTGYLKAIEVDVISPTATEAEKKMIEQLLKSGIFVD